MELFTRLMILWSASSIICYNKIFHTHTKVELNNDILEILGEYASDDISSMKITINRMDNTLIAQATRAIFISAWSQCKDILNSILQVLLLNLYP